MIEAENTNWHRNPEALRNNRIKVESPPAWVVRNKVKNASRIDNHPISMLLLDRQIHADQLTRYTRYVRRIETPQAVQQAGKIELDFDPTTQTLLIHQIAIYRDGKLKNLANIDDVQIIQRERDLEKGIYDGMLTALILIKDLRTGDIIDIATSIVSDNTVFPNHYWFTEIVQHSIPVARQCFSWLAQDHNRFEVKSALPELSYTDESSGDATRRHWLIEDSPGIEPPAFLPIGFNPFKSILISSFKSWKEVAGEFFKLWETKKIAGDKLPKEVKRLKDSHPEMSAELIQAAVTLVRDNIRYQGIETGHLGLIPEELKTIWDRRFGDCKEKTSLLCWILQQLGFEATPALVSSALLARVSEQLPAPIFDHVVVHLIYKGERYWIDPTNISQRGTLRNWKSLTFQKALLISPEVDQLTAIADPDPEVNQVKVYEHYKFKKGTSAHLQVTHHYHGIEADAVRSTIDSSGRSEIQGIFSDIVKSTRPEAEISTDIEIADDTLKNVITLSADFNAPDILKAENGSQTYICGFAPHSIVGKIAFIDKAERQHPLGLIHPVEIVHHTRIDHPDAKGAVVPKTIINNEFINFEAGTKNENTSPEIYYRYRSKSAEIPADQLHRYRMNLDQIDKVISLNFQCHNLSGKASTHNNQRQRRSNPAQTSQHNSGMMWMGLGIAIFVIMKIILFFAREGY